MCFPVLLVRAEGLRHNRGLISLDLRWNSAGEGGARALEAALQQNHVMLRLQLQGARYPLSQLHTLVPYLRVL